ncbi:MAG: hypothetical protein WC543_00095 [Candidatus Omnitrophota bacterium]
MNKDAVKNIALIFLLGITIFSMVKYVSELNARYRLQDSLAQVQSQVAIITQEKQNLLQELKKEQELQQQLELRNAALKENLKASKNRITRFFQEEAKVKSDLEDSRARLAILKAENLALVNSHKRLFVENEELKFKLSTVDELKKAIKELRNRKRKDLELQAEGNQGFITRNGQPTTVEKIKIEVIPASYKSQGDSTRPAQTKK